MRPCFSGPWMVALHRFAVYYTCFSDPDECYLHACNCLQYAFFTECIELCNQIISKVKGLPHSLVRLTRGKAYAHIHRRQMWNILKNVMLDVTVPWKTGSFVDRCASNAKKVIGDLGFALDQGVLDKDGSYLLDMAMIDYVLIKKQLKDIERCLLCRRRGVKLKESHTFPKFLLKEIINQDRKTLEKYGELGMPLAADLLEPCCFQNVSGKFRLDSPNTAAKYTLLCERCEQCLSQNGENQFQKEFMPPIYSDSNEVQDINYDSTIYSFCLGILFRSFVNNIFIHFANSDEIYSLFVACRQHLIQLPAKVTEKKVIPNPPPVEGIAPLSLPTTYLIISPSKLSVKIAPLIASMISGAYAWYLTAPLNGEPKTGLCHAAVVHMALCNIVVPFIPAQGALLDESYRIQPHGGVYSVPPEIKRWSATPPGVFQAIVDNTSVVSKQYQQVLSGMKTTKGDSRKAEVYIETTEMLTSTFMGDPIDISSLKSSAITPEEEELISLYVAKSNTQVKLLPDSFSMVDNPPKLLLKEGYKLLYHISDEHKHNTLFFAAESTDILNGKLIVIMKVKDKTENFKRLEGVHVHLKRDGSVCVTGFLQESNTETMKRRQYSRLKEVTERVVKAVDSLLQRCGSLNNFILCASIETRLAMIQVPQHVKI